MKRVINIILFLCIVVCIGLLGYSGYQIYLWHNANKNIEKQVKEIEEKVDVQPVEDNSKTEIINPPKKDENKFDPYWDYIKVKLINVDFTKLKEINNETVGWIQVGGTNVNYPFVQTIDNKYYLTHQLDGTSNTAGWIFMDYRNSIDNFDKNTILYGHGRLNYTMFGSLRNVVDKSWYENKNNYIVKISTETENTLWQVFSTYKIKTTSDYLQIDFNSDDDYMDFLNMLKNRSVHDYKVNLTPNDKIISLSTCHNDKYKIVLHAKLIKREKRE